MKASEKEMKIIRDIYIYIYIYIYRQTETEIVKEREGCKEIKWESVKIEKRQRVQT